MLATGSRSVVTLALATALTVGTFVGGFIEPAPAIPEPNPVSQMIVRYTDGAPVKRSDGKPWGVQCVDRRYRERLIPGRALGAGMYVVRLRPAVTPRVAARIARQLSACPGVAWAEAPTVVFSPGAREVSHA